MTMLLKKPVSPPITWVDICVQLMVQAIIFPEENALTAALSNKVS